MSLLHSALGYLALLACAWLSGKRARCLPWRTLAVASALQLLLTGLLLHQTVRAPVFAAVGGFVHLLRDTALAASRSLLFSGLSREPFTERFGPVFAIEMTSILVFVAALSRILYHYGILPWVIRLLSRVMQRVLGLSAAESIGTAANVFVGMIEAPLLVRPYVARLTESELFTLMTAGMATIAGTVLVVYASMLSSFSPDIAGHLLIASLISAPAAIAVSKIMIPEQEAPVTAGAQVVLPQEETSSGLDAAAAGATEGIQLAIGIIAMLIAFIGLVALANAAIGWVDALVRGSAAGTWSLQAGAGVVFRPFVWLMGIPWAESGTVAGIMGMKTILNEFVAYAELATVMEGAGALSERSFIIATYALCGFANFGSVAIMIGGIGGLAPERRADLARLGPRSIVSGTLSTMLTGCVIGIFV